MENFFLTILFTMILLNSIFIISSKNPVHSIFFLVLVFVCTTGLLLLLGVEFIAMLFLVVYVGAITVLFLFVIMMLNVKIIEFNEKFLKYIPIGIFIGLIFLIQIIFLIDINLGWGNLNDSFLNSSFFLETKDYFNITTLTNIEQLGLALYTKYVYLFLLGGLILLIAMVGAIVLTSQNNKGYYSQDYYKQTNRKLNQSLRSLI